MRTSWHEPNAQYEAKIEVFVKGVFESSGLMESLEAFVTPLIMPCRINSLAQVMIKMLVPSTPDFYRGSELWDLSLVGPYNRRPVDYVARAKLLERCATVGATRAMQESTPAWQSCGSLRSH
jgi:(1->4)-alpha-D-glucan 1-alpha-D-glucosylmutase